MSDIFKILEFFLTAFLGKTSLLGEKSLEISAEILNQIRRILILSVTCLGSLVLFCMGMSYLIERLLNNLDRGEMVLTPSIIFILIFELICLLSIYASTRKSKWLEIFTQNKEESKQKSHDGRSQLESVISLLILDFIKERESKRSAVKQEQA